MKKQIVYIISLVEHSVLFRRTIALLRQRGYDVSVVLLHHRETIFEQQLRQDGVALTRIHYKTKRSIPGSVAKLVAFLRKNKNAIVHTHLFEAGLAGMYAARLAGIKRRIHTRHDSMIHHDYHPSAVKYDKMTNRRATDIVAITENVRRILVEKENADAKKISVIHHGFDPADFAPPSAERMTAFYKRHPAIQTTGFVVGIISRLIEWKGIPYTIDGFAALLAKYPEAHLVIANARGPYADEIRNKLRSLPERSFTVIEQDHDIAALYHAINVFVHVPVDALSEAFGQVYIEAMAAGIPSVITRSGIACEYAEDGVNCCVVPYRSSETVAAAIDKLITDETLRKKITSGGLQLVQRDFTLAKMIERLSELYDR